MKKVISLILASVLVLSALTLTSCNVNTTNKEDEMVETLGGKTPKELYEFTKTNLSSATKYIVTTQQTITEKSTGNTIINTNTTSKVDGGKYFSKSTSHDSSMEIWYVDGFLYQSSAGNKMKAEISEEVFKKNYATRITAESTIINIPEELFDNISFENSDSNFVLTFVISAEKYEELFWDQLAGNTIVGSVVYKVFFDSEGNLTKATTSFDTITDGMHVHLYSTSTVTLENVTVTLPNDAQEYILIDPATGLPIS